MNDRNYEFEEEIYGEHRKKKVNLPPFFSSRSFILILVILAIAVYLLTSMFFIVGPDEEGLVLRFGKYIRSERPGVHIKMPSPIESVVIIKVTEVRRLEVGFRTVSYSNKTATYRYIPQEALMLTGDENIVSIELIVQYKIKNAYNYIFKVVKPDQLIKIATESALRQVIGNSVIDKVLTVGKYEVQENVKELLQRITDKYYMGIKVMGVQLQDVAPPKEVEAAFKDVASAKEDKNRYINEAEGYKNNILPKTRGEAVRVIKEAESYKISIIKKAQGDVARFLKMLAEYKKGKDITKERLYLETMEKVLKNTKKTIIDAESVNINLINFPEGSLNPGLLGTEVLSKEGK